jgi:peptidoglycan hydrolase-like protein with peptidoglycan-binding domain
LVLAFALGAIAYASGVYIFQVMNPSPKPPPDTMTARPVLLPSPAGPVETNLPVTATERPGQGELQTPEVWEVQARLEFLGMQPGSPDGISGPRTVAAIRRYEQSRGRAQTGKLDRELLERLRLEPN